MITEMFRATELWPILEWAARFCVRIISFIFKIEFKLRFFLRLPWNIYKVPDLNTHPRAAQDTTMRELFKKFNRILLFNELLKLRQYSVISDG